MAAEFEGSMEAVSDCKFVVDSYHDMSKALAASHPCAHL